MNIQTGGKVSGVYGIKVVRNAGTDNEQLEDFGESPNMLLDGFFERFAGGLSTTSWYMFVGTGTTPVDAAQTNLVNQSGTYETVFADSNDNVKVGNDYIASSTGVAEWDIGAIVGNISEVGVRLGSIIGSTVDSRALITDSQGNPTSITVTAEDKLVVSYTLKYIIPTSQQVSTFNFGGVQTTCTLERLGALNSGKNNIGSAFALYWSTLLTSEVQELINDPESEQKSGGAASTEKTISYPAAGVKRVSYFINTGTANYQNGLKYAFLSSGVNYNFPSIGIHFEPPIPKDATKTLTLTFDFTLTRA